jgi:hypothetical protein
MNLVERMSNWLSFNLLGLYSRIVVRPMPLLKLPLCALATCSLALPNYFFSLRLIKQQIAMACLNMFKNLNAFTLIRDIASNICTGSLTVAIMQSWNCCLQIAQEQKNYSRKLFIIIEIKIGLCEGPLYWKKPHKYTKSTSPQNSDLGLPFRHVLHQSSLLYQSNFWISVKL